MFSCELLFRSARVRERGRGREEVMKGSRRKGRSGGGGEGDVTG